jgi:hypothetical protein
MLNSSKVWKFMSKRTENPSERGTTGAQAQK